MSLLELIEQACNLSGKPGIQITIRSGGATTVDYFDRAGNIKRVSGPSLQYVLEEVISSGDANRPSVTDHANLTSPSSLQRARDQHPSNDD